MVLNVSHNKKFVKIEDFVANKNNGECLYC